MRTPKVFLVGLVLAGLAGCGTPAAAGNTPARVAADTSPSVSPLDSQDDASDDPAPDLADAADPADNASDDPAPDVAEPQDNASGDSQDNASGDSQDGDSQDDAPGGSARTWALAGSICFFFVGLVIVAGLVLVSSGADRARECRCDPPEIASVP